VPGLRAALRRTSAGVVGLSPIIGGRALRGMADACLSAIGVETSAEAVGRHYGGRSAEASTPTEAADDTAQARTPAETAGNRDSGVLDGWLVHATDTATVPGVTVRAVPLLMSDVPATAEMARAALDLAGVTVG
jgi:LPPG:FO 2-phospho-L-lactate transferase